VKEDLELTVTATSYAGTGPRLSLSGSAAKATEDAKPRSGGKAVITAPDGLPKKEDGSVDFKKMSPAQKLAYSRQRIQSDLVTTNGNSRA
jgi:hypothetical protein